MKTVRMSLVALLLALGMVASIGPVKADSGLLVEASGRVTFIGSARGQDFWQRVSGIIDFGPAAAAASTGTLDASTGSGCLHVGTSFSNAVHVCAPFAPGEVVLLLNSFEQGAGVLLVNTLGRTSERALAVVPLADETPPFISPLSPLFWIPTLNYELTADQVHSAVREYEADFFDVRLGYVRVEDQEAMLIDGGGIVVTDARIADTLVP